MILAGRRSLLWALFGLLACLLMAGGPVSAAAETPPVPALTQRVTDLTGTLAPAQRQALDDELAALQARKGAQLAVLIVPSTGAESIEQFATRVFEQWRLGRGKIDDGVLFVVAKNDRAMRIEVGYGLEGAISDVLAGRIIREQVIPHFQQDDYAAGIQAGVQALVALIDGEALPPPPRQQSQASSDGSLWENLLDVGLFLLVVLVAAPPLVGGLFAGVVGGFVSGSLLVGLGAGVGVAALSWILGLTGLKRALRNRGGGGGGRGGGGFGGGFGGGRSSGGGGFSGGGGRSGGGGASGRW